MRAEPLHYFYPVQGIGTSDLTHAAHPFVTFDVCYVPHRLEKYMERMAESMASLVRESQRRETTDALTFYGT